MRYSKEEMETALQKLNQKQKPVFGLLGALIGAFVGFVIYMLIAEMGGAIILMLAVPPAAVGFFARFTGQMFKLKYRLPVGIIGGVLHIIGCYMLGLNPLFYLFTPVAFGIAITLSKITLERIHVLAITQQEMGKLNIE